MTTRLYFDDPFLHAFDARVIGHGDHGGRASVILDRSAFYPEHGGQMADRGTLGGWPVVDVQIDDAGVVHHVLEAGELPPIGAELHGEIDRARRRVHMALHTGQHILSAALLEVARAETVSSRLGESMCTIDVDLAKVDEGAIARAESLANALVDDDLAIRAWFPSKEELAALKLRRPPKVDDNIRIVAVGDFDVSPCGGTHCVRSAQVGLVRVSSVERYKGGTRVVFAAGARARDELSKHDDALRALARSLTCAPTDVANAFDKVKRDLDDVRGALGRARGKLAESAAEALWQEAVARGDRRVVACFDEGNAEMLRAVSAKIVAHEGAVAILGANAGDGVLLLVDRAKEGATLDCGALVKKLAQAFGGRGGGRPDHAEGRLPADVDWSAVVATIG